MHRHCRLTLILCVLTTSPASAQEAPQPAQPQQEHEWLQQLAGEWETHGKVEVEPGQPEFECFGTETIRSIGGLWIVSEGESHPMGLTVTSQLTLGYSPVQKKFVGTWVDSMLDHMWKYEGTLDESGKKLTLLTEGPSFTVPGATAKYKEELEIKSKDERQFTSYLQTDEGAWVKFMTTTAKRTK